MDAHNKSVFPRLVIMEMQVIEGGKYDYSFNT
mgnify:CR=1 FL=1